MCRSKILRHYNDLMNYWCIYDLIDCHYQINHYLEELRFFIFVFSLLSFSIFSSTRSYLTKNLGNWLKNSEVMMKPRISAKTFKMYFKYNVCTFFKLYNSDKKIGSCNYRELLPSRVLSSYCTGWNYFLLEKMILAIYLHPPPTSGHFTSWSYRTLHI